MSYIRRMTTASGKGDTAELFSSIKPPKAYTNLTRHYKDSSEVCQKFGLSESDTNLSNFLQKLLKKDGE